jgi:hypothetical protein
VKKNLFKNNLILPAIILLFACASQAQQKTASCAELQKMVDETYNFKPSKLTDAERDAKSAAMDKVWNKVKEKPQELLPCLREIINSRANDAFFRFDASNLLIQLDRGEDAKKTLIKAYAEVDLGDINLRYWMPYIAVLGYEGFDTTAAGENWLKYPNPEYYLPQHGTLAVNKEIGALIIYGSMDEAIATPALARAAAGENHPGREIALRLLMQQATPESIQALKNLNLKGLSDAARQSVDNFLTRPNLLTPREGAPKITREQYLDAFGQLAAGKSQAFMKLASEVTDGEKDAVAVMKPEDIPLIRKARRVFAASATPHAAQWYKSFTDILLALTRKPEPVKQKARVN